MTYLWEARPRRAADRLRSSDTPVDQVAGRVGYASRSQFSRAFTTQFGITPTDYRRHNVTA